MQFGKNNYDKDERKTISSYLASHLEVGNGVTDSLKAEVVSMVDGGKANGSTIAFDGFMMRV